AAVCAIAVLTLLSLWALGTSGSVEYVRQTLPLHARAEVFDNYQYSLTHLLAVLGTPASLALALGSLSYIVLAVLAVLFALGEPARGLGPARAVLLPVAAVALGGTFIHYQEISLA